MAAQLEMEQGYVAVRPTVRIRRESVLGGETHLVLCFKGEGTLSREEIETDIAPELYEKLKKTHRQAHDPQDPAALRPARRADAGGESGGRGPAQLLLVCGSGI